jgi:hypothetical protein
MEANMALVTDKSELKPGLILFRRGDVEHRMWYCRVKMPKADHYKTVRSRQPTSMWRGNAPSIKTQISESA